MSENEIFRLRDKEGTCLCPPKNPSPPPMPPKNQASSCPATKELNSIEV